MQDAKFSFALADEIETLVNNTANEIDEIIRVTENAERRFINGIVGRKIDDEKAERIVNFLCYLLACYRIVTAKCELNSIVGQGFVQLLLFRWWLAVVASRAQW